MFERRINAQELIERLNADYYGPDYLTNQAKLDAISSEPLSSYYKSTGIGHTAAIYPHYTTDTDQSVPFLSGKSIKSGSLDTTDCERIKLSSHLDDLRNSTLKPGDLLVIRKGDPGNSAVVPENQGGCNCSSEVIYFKGLLGLDAYFLSSFLNSNHGRLAFRRLQRGTMIPGVSLLDVPGFQVPKPATDVRSYIGDKARQAERLRASAMASYTIASESLLIAIGGFDESESRFERISPDLLGNRLDQNHYRKKLLACTKQLLIGEHVFLGDKDYFTTIQDGDHGNPVYGTGPFYLRTSEMRSGVMDPQQLVSIDATYARGVSSSCFAIPQDIVFSIVGTLGLTSVVTDDCAGLMSRGIAKTRSMRLPTFYVKAFFRSPFFQAQLERHSVGSVQRGVYLSALGELIVPIIGEGQIAIVAESEELADALIRSSRKLVIAAKLLVEALIEGQISEFQLIAAQQALEARDDSLDRAILARLKTDGLDGTGEPLFPDLDQLYHLLGRAQAEA